MRIDIVLIVWKYWFPTFGTGTQAFWVKQNNSLCNKLILGIIYLISVFWIIVRITYSMCLRADFTVNEKQMSYVEKFYFHFLK